MPEPHDDPTGDATKAGSSRGWKIAAGISLVAAAAAMSVLGFLLFSGTDAKPKADVAACILDRDFTNDSQPGDAERAKEVTSGTVKVSGNGTGRNCPPKGSVAEIGLVQKTTDGGFTMRRVEGTQLGEQVELSVRTPDKPYIDIAHAQTHASLGQPIRVFTREVDGEDSVVYMDDPPPFAISAKYRGSGNAGPH